MSLVPTRIGELLAMAGLVSRPQIEIALRDQSLFPDKKLGEILVLRGWVKPETVEFFVYLWPKLLSQPKRYPLGYYLVASGVLTDAQLKDLLREQQKMGIRIGSLAVLRGWLKQETLNFLLQQLNPGALSESAFVHPHVPLAVTVHPGKRPQVSTGARMEAKSRKQSLQPSMKASRNTIKSTHKCTQFKPLNNPLNLYQNNASAADDLVLDENDLEIDTDWID